jgi:hypothetical protein
MKKYCLYLTVFVSLVLCLLFLLGCQQAPTSSGSSTHTYTLELTLEASAWYRENYISSTTYWGHDTGNMEVAYYNAGSGDIVTDAYMRFNTSTIPAGASIQSATLTFYIYTCAYQTNLTLSMITNHWNKTAYTSIIKGSGICGYTINQIGTQSIDIKTTVDLWAKGIANGGTTNEGFIIEVPAQQMGVSNPVEIYDFDHISYPPLITITYK